MDRDVSGKKLKYIKDKCFFAPLCVFILLYFIDIEVTLCRVSGVKVVQVEGLSDLSKEASSTFLPSDTEWKWDTLLFFVLLFDINGEALQVIAESTDG